MTQARKPASTRTRKPAQTVAERKAAREQKAAEAKVAADAEPAQVDLNEGAPKTETPESPAPPPVEDRAETREEFVERLEAEAEPEPTIEFVSDPGQVSLDPGSAPPEGWLPDPETDSAEVAADYGIGSPLAPRANVFVPAVPPGPD